MLWDHGMLKVPYYVWDNSTIQGYCVLVRGTGFGMVQKELQISGTVAAVQDIPWVISGTGLGTYHCKHSTVHREEQLTLELALCTTEGLDLD